MNINLTRIVEVLAIISFISTFIIQVIKLQQKIDSIVSEGKSELYSIKENLCFLEKKQTQSEDLVRIVEKIEKSIKEIIKRVNQHDVTLAENIDSYRQEKLKDFPLDF